MIRIIIIAVLILVDITLAAWLVLIKKNIRELRKEIKKTREEDYNRQMRVTLLDRDVENLTTELNKSIDYQKSLKLETEKSRRQLEQSISDIAHDLRTPLTVVKGNLQMLEKEDLTPKGREYLDISRRKADTLKGMVDEFFELSVLESDSKPVELCKLNVVSFLSEFIVENETLIRNHNLTPEITFPDKSIFVQGNKELLSRVFSNLIGNITKYAKGSFELVVSEECLEETAKMAGGRKISKESHEKLSENESSKCCRIRIGNSVENSESIDINHIFDRTYRADKARSDGSAGLGLCIVKLLVEKQKGIITAVLEEDKLYFDIYLNLKK